MLYFILNRFKRTRKLLPLISSIGFTSVIVINLTSTLIEDDSSAFHQHHTYQDLNWQLTIFYFHLIVNFSYCQFKQVLFFFSPIFIIAQCVYVKAWQDPIAKEVHDILPDHLKYFINTNFSKTINRVIGITGTAIISKYYEELSVINQIISKWANKNLHNQMI